MKRSESYSVVSDYLQPHGLCSPWNSPDQNTRVGSLSLLQGIFPTQALNWGLLNCRTPWFNAGSRRSAGEGIGYPHQYSWASLVAQLVKNLPECGKPGFVPWFGKIPWRRERLPSPVFWPGEFHELYSPWGSQRVGHDRATFTHCFKL